MSFAIGSNLELAQLEVASAKVHRDARRWCWENFRLLIPDSWGMRRGWKTETRSYSPEKPNGELDEAVYLDALCKVTGLGRAEAQEWDDGFPMLSLTLWADVQVEVSQWPRRPCVLCNRAPTIISESDLSLFTEFHDPCIENLPDVRSACCGHGRYQQAYLSTEAGEILRGEAALTRMRSLGGSPPTLKWPHVLLDEAARSGA